MYTSKAGLTHNSFPLKWVLLSDYEMWNKHNHSSYKTFCFYLHSDIWTCTSDLWVWTCVYCHLSFIAWSTWTFKKSKTDFISTHTVLKDINRRDLWPSSHRLRPVYLEVNVDPMSFIQIIGQFKELIGLRTS